jgi:hypothetical protein
VHSRAEALPPEALAQVWSLAETRLRDVARFLDETCFHAELRSVPDEVCSPAEAHWLSPKRSADEVRHCAVVEYCARPCRV